jgi:hypothetical protein
MGKIYDCKTFQEVMNMIIEIFTKEDYYDEKMRIVINHEFMELCCQTISVEFNVGNSSGWQKVTFTLPICIDDCPVDYLNKTVDYYEWKSGNNKVNLLDESGNW